MGCCLAGRLRLVTALGRTARNKMTISKKDREIEVSAGADCSLISKAAHYIHACGIWPSWFAPTLYPASKESCILVSRVYLCLHRSWDLLSFKYSNGTKSGVQALVLVQ